MTALQLLLAIWDTCPTTITEYRAAHELLDSLFSDIVSSKGSKADIATAE